ncbi:hypothetical protein SAMN05216206_2123 [Pseudomonas guineae]|uniref:Multifunctional fatty acid oxidation complex subunit alpha n=1 Tax=Pseudomonas guineae TaxID=425504 RepID=A0A1I3HVI4_9PSED|nr:PA1571 family protein [Pseudomonas guineae]SFI39756.1 hypothetical protein SAMN05216206_2123 [Pseudomonas guineae]|tara:strand:- start:22 stop:183 length:162 start_codon:yes stop_codon:yes gene_type:complete
MQSSQQNSPKTTPTPLGGSVIDETGREVPITEDMIQQACNALEKAQQPAAKHK